MCFLELFETRSGRIDLDQFDLLQLQFDEDFLTISLTLIKSAYTDEKSSYFTDNVPYINPHSEQEFSYSCLGTIFVASGSWCQRKSYFPEVRYR